MNKIKKSSILLQLGLALCFTSFLSAIELYNGKLNISGHYLGLWNEFRNNADKQSQFDFASNIDFNITFSDKLRGIIQLQMGTGAGRLGFVGPEANVTDLNIEYTPKSNIATFTAGSFDAPFGPYTRLSNNANLFENEHMINDLFYSSLAGPVGTLNSVGLKAEKQWGSLFATYALSNGTGENSVNEGNTYASVLQLNYSAKLQQAQLGFSIFTADDRYDGNNSQSNSFKNKYTAYMFHVDSNVFDTIFFDTYFGKIKTQTLQIEEKDSIHIYRLGLRYKKDKYSTAIQWSSWQPQKKSGLGNQGNSVNQGLNTFINRDISIADSHIHRVQGSFSYRLEPTLWLRVGIIYDDYQYGDDTQLINIAVNREF